MNNNKKDIKIILILNKIPALAMLIIFVFMLYLCYSFRLYFVSNAMNFIVVYFSYVFLILTIIQLCFNKYKPLREGLTIVVIIIALIHLLLAVEEIKLYLYDYEEIVSTYDINSREKIVISLYPDGTYNLFYKKRVRKHLYYETLFYHNKMEAGEELRNIEDIYQDLEQLCPDMYCGASTTEIYGNTKNLKLFKSKEEN